jgi:hypothetical protein
MGRGSPAAVTWQSNLAILNMAADAGSGVITACDELHAENGRECRRHLATGMRE